MKPDSPIDCAVFQLSPRRSRCELFVSRGGDTEKLASGSVKPFVMHLKVAEEQVAQAVQSIKLEVGRCNNEETWFTKGTLERFVRFVSTPEVLELVNTVDAEMSQLEAARKIYSQGAGDQISGTSGAVGTGSAADATKKELLRAIDVRLVAARQDLTTACSRAAAVGFNPDAVSELQFFADHFGAHRLNEACTKFLSFCQRRPDLLNQWKPSVEESLLRVSCESDMSIDDLDQELSGLQNGPQQAEIRPEHATQQPSDKSNNSMHQQLKRFATLPTQHTVSNENDTEKEKQEDPSSEPSSSETNRPARRLSVQDRISLFENKQKENSGGKPVIGKPAELRRLSSDVSSAATPTGVAEKAVLRRWSGASDMSIDSSGSDKKDNAESPVCTSLSSVSQANTNPSSHAVQCNTASSMRAETKSSSDRAGFSASKNQADLQPQQENSSKKEGQLEFKGKMSWKQHADSHTESKSCTMENADNVNVRNQASQEKFKVYKNDEESGGSKHQVDSRTQLSTFWDSTEPVGAKNRGYSEDLTCGSITKGGSAMSDSGNSNRMEDGVGRDQVPTRIRGAQGHSRSLSGQLEGGFKLSVGDAQRRSTKANPSASQPKWRSYSGEVEDSQKDLMSSERKPSKLEDSGIPRMKFQKPEAATPEQLGKSQARRDASGPVCIKPALPSKTVSGTTENSGTVLATPVEHLQRVRHPKGNQELNDELKIKASELEKLFEEHKLRVPSDQSSSARRNKHVDNRTGKEVHFEYRKQAGEFALTKESENVMATPPGSMLKFSSDSQTGLGVTPDNSGALTQKLSKLGFSDDSRGKFYERYMQKRETKLREEWSTKRPEKEAKLKAMKDCLERSRAEMKAKLSGSVNKQNSISGSRRRVERLRSFNVHSVTRMHQSEEDGDLPEFVESRSYGQVKSYPGEAAFRSTQSKKALPNKIMTSTTLHTGAGSIPRSSAAPNSNPGKRRVQSENPLAQSVPNFSDLRKENTKPSSGVSKMMTRAQVRKYAHSKSSTEETSDLRVEKSQRSHSTRKSSVGNQGSKDISSFNSNGVTLAATRLDNISKLKASSSAERIYNDDGEFDYSTLEEENDEIESMDLEDCSMDNGRARMNAGSNKLDYSGSEDSDPLISVSQVAELPPAMPSTFNPVGSLQDSPGESPMSWNASRHQSFSYLQETSGIYASADSPEGSPASWNCRSLNQTETDVARMRKKWGSSQTSVMVANSSQNQSRKDVTKGFKRLLKFGWKNRGTENMADWISATTSEGDDDSEELRDPANRSSEDLRKSRMGFSHGHLDDGFSDSELFSEQVQALQSSIPAPPTNFKLRDDHMSGTSLKAPRSFFSLSTFRSKGADFKTR